MAKQTGGNERRQDGLTDVLGSSVDSPGSQRLRTTSGQGDEKTGRRGDGTSQQTYYCSPPYFSSSASSSSSSSPSLGSPSERPSPAAGGEYSDYRGRPKSGSTSTPLTPQEFELLSDSNPFKQDIAEKYGIAYPGITTRAHSSEFIGQAERESEAENSEFGGARRKKRSASVNDSVDSFTLDISTWRASSEKISRMCRGLNAFLLKNQESIEQSIASLDDTDVVIPTSEGAGVFSAPKKYDIVYVGKQNSSEEINSPVHDISPERLLDAELTEIQLEGKRGSLQSSDSQENVGTKPGADTQPGHLSAFSMFPRPKQALEQTKSDPYTAIKSEETQRKKTGTKIFASSQSGRVDSEDDQLSFECLSTRSFEESSLPSQTPRDAASKKTVCDTNTPKSVAQSGPKLYTSALTSGNVDLLSFDDDEDSKPPATRSGNENYSIKPVACVESQRNNSAVSSFHSTPSTSREPSQVRVKTINKPSPGGRAIDSKRSSQDPVGGDKRKDSTKRGSETSPPHEVLATFDPFASVEKTDSKSLDATTSDTRASTTQGRGEKFSSSFYSVFSTTVNSLEDIDSSTEQKRVDKADTSPEQHSSTWDAGDTTPSADSVFSAFSTGYERSISESSQGRKESFGYPLGDVIPQKKSKASEDSGESSKESVSRDSMRVNLSQDSSIADLHDDSSGLSHFQINGYPDNDEIASFQPPVNTTPRIEVGLPQRHLDLASMLLPMAESASTDSMFVHVSTDSLHSGASGKSAESQEPEVQDQRKLSDKSSRAQLSIDLRRKNLMEQSRRRSLPSSQLKNSDKGKREPPALYASQSLDSTGTPELPLQRRSSVPVSRPRPNAARTLQRIGSTSAPKLQYTESDTETINEAPAVKAGAAVNTSTEASKLVPTSPPQAVSPGTARPRPSSKRGSVSSEKGVPISINLGQVVNILAGTTIATTQPTATKVKVQKPQRTKIQFTIAAKAPEPSTTAKQNSSLPRQMETVVSSFPSSSRSRHISSSSSSQLTTAKQDTDRAGFLQERKQEMCNVDAVQPPDLVPYEETFTSPLRSLSEASQPAAEDQSSPENSKTKLTSDDSNCFTGSGMGVEAESENNILRTETNSRDNMADKNDAKTTIETQNSVSTSIKDKPVKSENEGEKGSSRNSIVKSNSGSDSDGGDIDTIVQEFKEDISEEDDIDNLVKEFIEEHPEAAATAPQPEPEMMRQHSVGFNKFGRVLNKMQSVTKYMTKKKTFDEAPKSPPAKLKMGRRSRTVSQNESDDVSSEVTAGSAQQQKDNQTQASDDGGEKKEETDPFELLSKAAEVFKAQTVNKKRSPRHKAPRVWRSMTVDTDVADLEGNEDCDLVTRAAVLFKGFKGKKAQREELSSSSAAKTLASTSESSQGEDAADKIAPGTSRERTEKGDKEGANGRSVEAETFSALEEEPEHQTEEKEQVPPRDKNSVTSPTSIPATVSTPGGQNNSEKCTHGNRSADTGIDTDTNTEMEESISKMDDSGFESSIRYAAENSVKSDDDDDTDGPGKVSSLLDSAREHTVFSVVEVTTPEINTYENMTSKLGASIHDYVEKCMLTSIEKAVVYDRRKQDIITGDGIILNEVEWPDKDSKKNAESETEVRVDESQVVGDQKDEVRMMVSSTADDHSAATDSGLDTELKFEQAELQGSRPVSQTCDLILSTGYDDTKNVKQQHTDSSECTVVAAPQDAREKTNGKLEELTKEILAVETASFEVVSSKPEGNKLNIKSPEYQRLSSDSSENHDSTSLTVNLPDSPENGISLDGDGPFSLCCGANFKINLNCTAMMKKPERRPSKVVIENKRCAMTEEEKMFPLKVSSSFRENSDKDKENPPEGAAVEKGAYDAGAAAASSSPRENTLKVSEHERNRNFAGSREELTDRRNGSQSKDAKDEASERNIEDGNLGGEGKLQKRRSVVEEVDKDKAAVENYNTVLGELSKKQAGQEAVSEELNSSGKEKDASITEAQERKERARSKRYGRVISDSEFDDGLLPSENSVIKTTLKDNDTKAPENICTDKICEPKTYKEEEAHTQGKAFETVTHQEIETDKSHSCVVTTEPTTRASVSIQPGMDVYDNVKLSDHDSRHRVDAPPPLPVRDPIRQRPQSSSGNAQSAHRYHAPAESMSSVVSDEGGRQGIRADVYLKARRAYIVQPQGKTKWVSSTPHLPAIERGGDIHVAAPQGARHSSFPHLHANSDLDVSATPGHQCNYTYKTHHRGHSEGSASSFGSESVCWGNYARVADLQLQERAPSCDDSESSTSGLFIPGGGGGIPAGCGRASTLSDVSDGYIFGDYSTVKDDIQGEEYRGVIRPLDNQNQQTDNSFRFRHFPASGSHVHYENIEDLVVTTQPMGGPRHWASGPDIYCDNNYAVIGYPQQVRPDHRVLVHPTARPVVSMSSIGVQMSGSPSLARQGGGALRVSNCASQTSLDSLIGLVSHDASDILEGLPVYEYTLGAGVESEDDHSDRHSLSAVASTQCPDLGQPDVTRQTASLDRQQLRYKKKKSWEVSTSNNDPAGRRRHGARPQDGSGIRPRSEDLQAKRKETRVTFSRDAVLTEVIDELRKSEAEQEIRQQQQEQENSGGGRGFRVIAASTLTSIGGGVKEFARMINSPFHCCRSARAEPKAKPKVGGPVVL